MPSSLDPDVMQRLQEAIRTLCERARPDNPEKAQSLVAPKLGIDPSQVSRILKQGKGGSLKVIRAVARELNIPPEQIIQPTKEAGRRLRQARELPGYNDAYAELRKRAPREYPHFSVEDFERAGDARLDPEPTTVTVRYLLGVADALKRASTVPPKSKTVRAAKRIS
jgi:transcriptional regulator with XRE-family HTH domain